jgi:SfnB family sulfur acquisition oxidoreductase
MPFPADAALAAVDEPPPAVTIIRNEAEAIETARRLARSFAEDAAERDRLRRLPHSELDEFSRSGLWAITVPKEHGGAGLGFATVAEVIDIIATADGSLGQIPVNHFGTLEIIALSGREAQKREIFGAVLRGARLGNATAERHTSRADRFETRIRRHGPDYVVTGRKFFASGALYAHYVPIAAMGEDGKEWLAVADRDAPGLQIIDDWSSFGMRTTASGTVVLEEVIVPAARVIPSHLAFERPTPIGAILQLLQSAIDLGIARGAIEATLDYVRRHARPWIDSGLETATEDPLILAQVGDLEIRLHAAEALMQRAGRAVEQAHGHPEEDVLAAASIAVAEAKVLTTEIAILAANKLFELSGTRSTLAAGNLDRFWRDARTHTLHDPVRWKYYVIGQYYLNGRPPARHAWI